MLVVLTLVVHALDVCVRSRAYMSECVMSVNVILSEYVCYVSVHVHVCVMNVCLIGVCVCVCEFACCVPASNE